jgi:hypothetical protein
MELILKLEDESKLEALLTVLRGFTASEGVTLAVESLERRSVIEPPQSEFNWAKWEKLTNRDRRLSGQPERSPIAEEQWIAEQVQAARAEERQ